MREEAPRKIVSRRNRPAKAPLSRDAIVSTALHILERDGLSALSLRRVAAALDTGAASLYVYVANLEEVHALMLDRALAAVQPTDAAGLPWRDRLKAFLLAYLHVLYKRQGLAQLALSTIASGPNSLRIWEALLRLLKEGGVDDLTAAWGVDLLTLYVTAIAAEQNIRRECHQGLERVKNALSTVSEKQFPLVFALKETLLSGGGETRAEWALDVIVDGITGGRLQPRPAKARGRGSKRWQPSGRLKS
jgi:AcrR family transcriptional regulator